MKKKSVVKEPCRGWVRAPLFLIERWIAPSKDNWVNASFNNELEAHTHTLADPASTLITMLGLDSDCWFVCFLNPIKGLSTRTFFVVANLCSRAVALFLFFFLRISGTVVVTIKKDVSTNK